MDRRGGRSSAAQARLQKVLRAGRGSARTGRAGQTPVGESDSAMGGMTAGATWAGRQGLAGGTAAGGDNWCNLSFGGTTQGCAMEIDLGDAEAIASVVSVAIGSTTAGSVPISCVEGAVSDLSMLTPLSESARSR